MNPISSIKIAGKFLDQPMLVSKVSQHIPKLLIGGAVATCAYKTLNAPQEERKKTFIRNASVLTFTVLSSLAAIRGINFIKTSNGKPLLKGLIELATPEKAARRAQRFVSAFLKGNKVDNKALQLLEKAKSTILRPSEINDLSVQLGKSNSGKKLFSKLFPAAKNLNSKEIFSEIKSLSLLGAIPVLGGITGGLIGDKLTGEKNKCGVANKFKEGFYQFFANIFLCNVGAGTALYALEKANIHSRAARVAGMAGGIVTVGILGGSLISNFLAKNFFNPIVKNGPVQYIKDAFSGNLNQGKGIITKNLNEERHPEAADVMIHTDDFATIGLLSGLKWVLPALPLFYSVSGYRAGMGYRNGNDQTSVDNLKCSNQNINQNIEPIMFTHRRQCSVFDRFESFQSNH